MKMNSNEIHEFIGKSCIDINEVGSIKYFSLNDGQLLNITKKDYVNISTTNGRFIQINIFITIFLLLFITFFMEKDKVNKRAGHLMVSDYRRPRHHATPEQIQVCCRPLRWVGRRSPALPDAKRGAIKPLLNTSFKCREQ